MAPSSWQTTTINLGVGEKPAQLAISPDGTTLYVGNNPGDQVWAIQV